VAALLDVQRNTIRVDAPAAGQRVKITAVRDGTALVEPLKEG